jgi:hypothetical protein
MRRQMQARTCYVLGVPGFCTLQRMNRNERWRSKFCNPTDPNRSLSSPSLHHLYCPNSTARVGSSRFSGATSLSLPRNSPSGAVPSRNVEPTKWPPGLSTRLISASAAVGFGQQCIAAPARPVCVTCTRNHGTFSRSCRMYTSSQTRSDTLQAHTCLEYVAHRRGGAPACIASTDAVANGSRPMSARSSSTCPASIAPSPRISASV